MPWVHQVRVPKFEPMRKEWAFTSLSILFKSHSDWFKGLKKKTPEIQELSGSSRYLLLVAFCTKSPSLCPKTNDFFIVPEWQ